MSTFTTLNEVTKIKNKTTNEIVVIYKVQKDGTKRTFFQPKVEDKAIDKTLWARLYDAENVARRYLNR